jgi:hypothetical protein
LVISEIKQPARASTRQPLISRAMKFALMAEPSQIGNDEPWNPLIRRIGSRALAVAKNGKENEDTSPTDGVFCRS